MVSSALPDDELRRLLAAWRADPDSEGPAVALANAFIERARALREPGFFGRAEAVLEPRAAQPGASAALRRLYAQSCSIVTHSGTRQSCSIRSCANPARSSPLGCCAHRCAWCAVTSPEHAGLRALVAGGGARIGFACLAEALAGSGQFVRARPLLDSLRAQAADTDPAARAYLLATRAELRERTANRRRHRRLPRGAGTGATRRFDSRRARGRTVGRARADSRSARSAGVDKPGLALLVRSAALSAGARARRAHRARGRLARARNGARRCPALPRSGDAGADQWQARARAGGGTQNFDLRRSCPTCACWRARRVPHAIPQRWRQLRQWLGTTGYRDVVTENILGAAAQVEWRGETTPAHAAVVPARRARRAAGARACHQHEFPHDRLPASRWRRWRCAGTCRCTTSSGAYSSTPTTTASSPGRRSRGARRH